MLFSDNGTLQILMEFSPRKNLLGLIKNPKTPSKSVITSLNGIRVFSMTWVIVAHLYMRIFQAQPVNNLLVAFLGTDVRLHCDLK